MRQLKTITLTCGLGLVLMSVGGCQQEPVSATTSVPDGEPRVEEQSSSVSAETATTADASADEFPEDAAQPATRGITYRPDGVADLSFDDIALDLEADEYRESALTDDVKSLDGKRIIIRGFILGASVFKQSGIKDRLRGTSCGFA